MKPTIVVSEDGMFSSEPMSVVEICNIFCAALTGAVQDIRPNYADNPDSKKIDKELFDCLNYSFSKCLELTFPEYELHPEITEEVLKKEEELLREKVAEKEKNAKVIPLTLNSPDGNKEDTSEV